MQNVTGGTSPLPAIRPSALDGLATLQAVDPVPETAGDQIPTVEQPRDTGYGTGAATTGARPSALSLPGISRPGRTADLAEEAEGSGSFETMDLPAGPYIEGSSTTQEMGSTSKGTSKGTTGTRRT